MYRALFDEAKQNEMRHYFYDLAVRLGRTKIYRKNELIELRPGEEFGIVLSGLLYQNVLSVTGQVHGLYVLSRGEIFGETVYFCQGSDPILNIVKETVEVSFVSKRQLEIELSSNPESYRFFIHSITRKFRIVMLQMTTHVFNDSLGKLAGVLLRLASCSDTGSDNKPRITISFTHQELANNIGCSRITVTNSLKVLTDEKAIRMEGKYIVIEDVQMLERHIDPIMDEH